MYFIVQLMVSTLLAGCVSDSAKKVSHASQVDPGKTLVAVMNPEDRHDFAPYYGADLEKAFGVVVDKEKGWILTVVNDRPYPLESAPLTVVTSEGSSQARILAEDPVYGVRVIVVQDTHVLKGREQAIIGSGALGKGTMYRLSKRTVVKHKQAFCCKKARIPAALYPTQNVMLHEEQESLWFPMVTGTAFFSQDNTLEGLWQSADEDSAGWVPTAVLHNLMLHATKAHNQSALFRTLSGVSLAYINADKARVLLGEHTVETPEVLYVRELHNTRKDQGLQVGDVLVRINTHALQGCFETLMQRIKEAGNQHVSFDVIRYGKLMQVSESLVSAYRREIPDFVSMVDDRGFVFKATPYLAQVYSVPEQTYLHVSRRHYHGTAKIVYMKGEATLPADLNAFSTNKRFFITKRRALKDSAAVDDW